MSVRLIARTRRSVVLWAHRKIYTFGGSLMAVGPYRSDGHRGPFYFVEEGQKWEDHLAKTPMARDPKDAEPVIE